MKSFLSLVFIFLISGCSSRDINLTMLEANQLPSVGEIKITTPDTNKFKINPRPSFLFVTYGKPNIIETKIFLAINIENIKSNEVLNIKIPDYEGLTVTGINFYYMYEKDRTITGTYQVKLNPVYNYDSSEIEKLGKTKSYQNNDVIIYEDDFGIKLQPNLKLFDFHAYSDHDFTYGTGLSSV